MRTLSILAALVSLAASQAAYADGNLHKVNHIIVIMQENHSFDNYLGVLPYVPNGPYHPASGSCSATDHQCVDGLSCTRVNGVLACTNSNLDDDGTTVTAFHEPTRCLKPDLNHEWLATHQEANYNHPNATLSSFLADGFVRVNDATEQLDNGVEARMEDQTIGFYNQNDLPFYYGLAEHFAMSDRYFSSLLGPTLPNRFYFMAATSFGHLTTADTVPPPNGYKPITGTIFDLLDKNGVTWGDYFQDIPQAAAFRPVDSHFFPLAVFLAEAAGVGPAIPQVSFIDPNLGAEGTTLENDEHPPTDIQRGQAYVSEVVNAVRNGPYWKDSIIIITYDEHGGFYDHAKPPHAAQGGALNPDGINPGQCEDLSLPPLSEQRGWGAECSYNFTSSNDTSVHAAEALCPAMTSDPRGAYPASCANFNQLGIRVPFIAVSPFSKPSYVSHVVGDHASILALIEKRFLTKNGVTQHLTLRDQYAHPLLEMFDFTNSPSLNTSVGSAAPPANDCTP